MQTSMWTSYLYEWTPHAMVRCFAQHGWQTLELSDEHGHDLLKRGDPQKIGERFRRFAADHGVSFPQGHFYLCTKGIRPEDLAGRRPADVAPADETALAEALTDMRRWIDLFHALGVRAGVLHGGGLSLAAAGWAADRIFARRVESLRRIAEYARGGATVICLENLGRDTQMATAAQLNRLIDAAGMPNVGICLDTGHANLSGVDNPAFIREAGARLKALHIADNLGHNDDHMLPYGRGTVKWPEVVAALRQVRYRGLFNFEVPGENRCPKPVRLAKLDYALGLGRWMCRHGAR